MVQQVGGQDLGDVLRRSRERLGMSRRDLAEATGLSYPYISQLETGYRQPSPAAIKNLAGVLQVKPEELLDPSVTSPNESALPVGNSGDWLVNNRFAGSSTARGAAAGAPSAAGVASHPFRSAPAPAVARTPPQPPPEATRVSRLVDQALALLVTVPPEHRLGAVNRIQANLVEMVVDEQVRRDNPDS